MTSRLIDSSVCRRSPALPHPLTRTSARWSVCPWRKPSTPSSPEPTTGWCRSWALRQGPASASHRPACLRTRSSSPARRRRSRWLSAASEPSTKTRWDCFPEIIHAPSCRHGTWATLSPLRSKIPQKSDALLCLHWVKRSKVISSSFQTAQTISRSKPRLDTFSYLNSYFSIVLFLGNTSLCLWSGCLITFDYQSISQMWYSKKQRHVFELKITARCSGCAEFKPNLKVL